MSNRIVFGSKEAEEQRFRDEMAQLERETLRLALTDDGEGWEDEPMTQAEADAYMRSLEPIAATASAHHEQASLFSER